MGLSIERLKTRRVGNFEDAIIDLQERVDTLERHRKVKVKEAKQDEAVQSEIDAILSRGGGGHGNAGPGGLWDTLHSGGS